MKKRDFYDYLKKIKDFSCWDIFGKLGILDNVVVNY